MSKAIIYKPLICLCALLYGCGLFNDCEDPCIDDYSYQFLWDSLAKYKIWRLGNSYNCNELTDCTTIDLQLSFEKNDSIKEDFLGISAAKLFFENPLNKKVQHLNLTVERSIPSVGKEVTRYFLKRNDFQKKFSSNNEIEFADDPEFNVAEEIHFTESTGNKNYNAKGLELIVKTAMDPANPEKLAAKIKAQYKSKIHNEEIEVFKITIRVDSLKSEVYKNKSYEYFYTKRNNNL